MKASGVFAVVLLLVVAFSEEVRSQSAADVAAFKKLKELCIEEMKIGADEAKLIMEGREKDVSNPSKEFKCFHSCMYKKMNLMSADGKPKNEEILKYIQARFQNIPMDKIKMTAASCAASKAATDCEFMHSFETCLLKGLTA